MEPKEPSPTHPNRTEHKQEPPTCSRGRPRLPTEQKEQPPKRPRGRPPLTIEQKEERKHLFSADSIDSDSYDASLYPIEFLNSLSVPGLPPHVLNLKIGAPIILLRTIDIHSGLCNGTRLIVENIQPHCITSKIITGPGKNNIALIPRINLTPSNTRLPFTFSRRQFPVKLAYAMTINKSQGQSLTKVGIYLPQCVFSHGQLYVAFSRAQDPENVKTFIIPIENKQGPMPSPLNNTYTSNVVYRNVLL